MRKTHKERSAFIAAATILSLSCPSSPASAQTPQANAVEHFAQAIVGVRRCALRPEHRIDDDRLDASRS
jgi:hypothetical protein